jgi:hypothetical protein
MTSPGQLGAHVDMASTHGQVLTPAQACNSKHVCMRLWSTEMHHAYICHFMSQPPAGSARVAAAAKCWQLDQVHSKAKCACNGAGSSCPQPRRSINAITRRRRSKHVRGPGSAQLSQTAQMSANPTSHKQTHMSQWTQQANLRCQCRPH